MRRWTIGLSVLLGILIIVLIVMFAMGDDQPTTTTTLVTTTTMPGESTTTAPVETTTTIVETTTTVADTTTTTDDGLLEGNWADQPLVAAGFGALGWWDGDDWVQSESGVSLPIAGGEDYQVARLGVEGVTTAGAEELVCDPLNIPGVVFDDPDLLGGFSEGFGVAISAPWVLTPHLVEETEDDGTYSAVASSLLAERGLTVSDPPIKSVLRVDLEGDGVNEVVVIAEDVPDSLLAEVGDYSLAFMQRVVGGTVQSLVFGDSVVAEVEEGEVPFVTSFAIGSVSDLSGDGKMEVVLDSRYYEGVGVEVWEYVNDDIGLLNQIATGCGS